MLCQRCRAELCENCADKITPHWDRASQTLWFGNTVAKRYRWQAKNQWRILDAFQEEGWPTRILDPLPPTPERKRLADTVVGLNRNMLIPAIAFSGDGTGHGVIWRTKEQ